MGSIPVAVNAFAAIYTLWIYIMSGSHRGPNNGEHNWQ